MAEPTLAQVGIRDAADLVAILPECGRSLPTAYAACAGLAEYHLDQAPAVARAIERVRA